MSVWAIAISLTSAAFLCTLFMVAACAIFRHVRASDVGVLPLHDTPQAMYQSHLRGHGMVLQSQDGSSVRMPSPPLSVAATRDAAAAAAAVSVASSCSGSESERDDDASDDRDDYLRTREMRATQGDKIGLTKAQVALATVHEPQSATQTCGNAAGRNGTLSICSICLDDFGKTDKVCGMVVCGHRFHSMCIRSWLRRVNKCPNCQRTALQPDAPPPSHHVRRPRRSKRSDVVPTPPSTSTSPSPSPSPSPPPPQPQRPPMRARESSVEGSYTTARTSNNPSEGALDMNDCLHNDVVDYLLDTMG